MVLEILQHGALAQNHLDVIAFAAREILTVDSALEIDADPISLGRRTLHRAPGHPLLAQVFQHPVHIGFGDLGVGPLDLDGFKSARIELGQDLEGGAVFQILPVLQTLGFDPRPAQRIEFFRGQGFVQAVLHQFADRLIANLIAIESLDQLERDFARTEPIHLHPPGQGLQPVLNFLGEPFGRNLHGDPALQIAQRFNGNLH